MIAKADFHGSPHIGLFCISNDDVSFIPPNSPPSFIKHVKKILKTDVVRVTLADTTVIGIFGVLNNKKMYVPDIVEKQELKVLKDHVPEVIVLKEKYSALGNLIAMNDKGLARSKYIKKLKQEEKIDIAGIDLIGSVLFVNNKGFLVHRDAQPKDLKQLKKIFKVDGDVGSVNFGDPYINSGIISNKHGTLVGYMTSGPELNRIDEVFYLK